MEARLREGEASARDSVGGLPERPRLRLGCCWFEGADGRVVRSVRGAFRVPPSHVEAMRTIFARLDGRHDYEAVLGAVPTETAFYSLRLLDSLAQVGMLGDGPAPAPAEPPVPTSPRLDGVRVAVLDDGLLATALTAIPDRGIELLRDLALHGDRDQLRIRAREREQVGCRDRGHARGSRAERPCPL